MSRAVSAFAAFMVLVASVASQTAAQDRIDKKFDVGELGYLEHTEPCEWLTFDDVNWVTEQSGRIYFATKPGRFKIAAMSPTKANKVLAFYTVTIGEPEPPKPDPDDKKPPKPKPEPQPISTWTEQIKTWTEALPAQQKSQIPQVIAAFERASRQIGTEVFTGPDIRAATAKELATVPGFAAWLMWDTQRTDADAAWSRDKYRDADDYKDRWKEVISGLSLVKVPAAEVSTFPPVVVGTQIVLEAQRHQIRGDRLLQYVCPQNGQRCRWQDMGKIVGRGPGWVIVQ